MTPDRYALLVGAPDRSLSGALEAALPVLHCPVAGDDYCPAMSGEPCALRANARLSIVYVEPGDDEQRLVACVAQDRPVLAVVAGVDFGPLTFGRFAIVGEDAGPLALLTAIASLVDGFTGSDDPT